MLLAQMSAKTVENIVPLSKKFARNAAISITLSSREQDTSVESTSKDSHLMQFPMNIASSSSETLIIPKKYDYSS